MSNTDLAAEDDKIKFNSIRLWNNKIFVDFTFLSEILKINKYRKDLLWLINKSPNKELLTRKFP